MTLRKRTKDTEDEQHRTKQQDPRSTEQPKSREEVIHEVIDEWLAPTFAHWIASKDFGPHNRGS